MRIDQIPTSELQRILAATERAAGPESVEVQIMRRELARREQPPRRRRRKGVRRGA